MEYILIGFVSLFTSVLSAIAGGGGGLLTGPAMLLIGFSPNVVVASQKAGGIGVNLGAMTKFIKHPSLIQWKLGVGLSVLAVVASYIGTSVVFRFSEDAIRDFIGVIVLVMVPVIYLRRKDGLKQRATTQVQKIFGTIVYGFILTVQAAVGGGIGTLNMYVLMGPMGLDALQANATKRLVGLTVTVSSLLFFIGSGYVDWKLAGVSFISTLIGGSIGAGVAIEKGAGFVRQVLIVVSIVMAIILLID